MQHTYPIPASNRILLSLVVTSIFFLVGCGGGNSATLVPPPTPTPATPTGLVQLRVGDAPADQLINFEITIASPIVATLATGEKVNATLGNNRIELSHTAGKLEPLLTLSLPQGTYKSIDIGILDPAVTYIYTHAFKSGSLSAFKGPELVSKDFPGNQTVMLIFDPPVTVGSDASIANLEVNLANSLVFNPDDGQEITGVNFTPASFTFTKNAIAPPDSQQHMTGELESVWGTVSAISGNTVLVLNAGQSGAVLQIATDSSTQFHDSLKGINDTVGRLIEVEGFTQSNGTMVAREVELLASSNGASIEGVVLDSGDSLVNTNALNLGHQASSFTMLAQDALGNGSRNDDVGWTFTVHTDYLTSSAYEVDYGKCDWSGLGTPVPGPLFPFDAAHIFPGQRVGVTTSSVLPNGDFTNFTATGVYLEQQAVTGTIIYYHSPEQKESTALSGYAGAWFVLRLPDDSYVHTLSGRSFVLVYQGAAADLELLPSNTSKTLGTGSIVRVRGLMFAFANWFPRNSTVEGVSHAGGTLTMIPRRITEIAPAVD